MATQDWYANKKMHEKWLLPSLNPYFSKIRSDLFDEVRKETNIVESGHAATNAQTGTRLPLLLAIERARNYDTSVWESLVQRDKMGITANRQGSDLQRQNKKQQRASTRNRQQAWQDAIQAKKEVVAQQLEENQKQAAELKSRTKELNEQLKHPPKPRFNRPGNVPLRPGLYAAPESGEGVSDFDPQAAFPSFDDWINAQPALPDAGVGSNASSGENDGEVDEIGQLLKTYEEFLPTAEVTSTASGGHFVAPSNASHEWAHPNGQWSNFI